jgi:predicted transcriptional regulator
MPNSAVSITLTNAQVSHVVRDASRDKSVWSAFAGILDRSALAATYRNLSTSPRHSRSLLLGLLIFVTLPADGKTIGIAEIASELGMSPSTTHRYVATLLAAGLVEQNPDTREYRIATQV